MGLNRAFDRPMFVIGGAVKTSGGSIDLAKGQLALIDNSVTTQNGAKVTASATGKAKDAKDFVIRCGISDRTPDRSHSNKNASTMPFSLNEVVDLRVSAPEQTERTVDEVVIGYDGFDENTAFSFKTGDAYFRLSLELQGGHIAYRGGKGDIEMVNINVEIPECDPFDGCVDCDECSTVDCKAITMEAIERLKRKQLSGGMLVSEVADITPVFSCDTAATAVETPYNYYTLDVCDTGTDEALALIDAQYDAPVIRINRVGSTSTYQVLLVATAGAPTDYSQALASIIKGCSACPSGYTATSEGVLYAITLEDNGTDETAALAADLATAGATVVAGTVLKADGQNAGVGYYTIVLEAALTDAQLTAYLAIDTLTLTATLENLGSVTAICENATVTTTAWAVGDTCNAIQERYTIVLPDDVCGNDRLAEINDNYSQTVTIAFTASSTAITLTGTGGSATVTIGTDTYLQAFDTDLATTAAAFVTTNAVAILAASGYVVTSAGDVITFALAADTAPNIPTVANTTGSLVGTAVTTYTNDVAACQTRYEMWVISNLVCDECDVVFKDYYVTTAPEGFDVTEWEKAANLPSSPSGNCLCGIRIKGKTFDLRGELALRDVVGFVETSTKIRVSAGYPEEIREGIGALPEGAFEGKYLSKWVPRTHLAGNLTDLENEGRAYFTGATDKDYLGKVLRGEISNMEDETKQYVQYTLEVSHFSHTQGFAGRINESINYDIFVEVGRHNAVENLLNDIASNAGVSIVSAFGA